MWFRKTLVFSITFLFITAGTTSSIPLTVSGYTSGNTLYVGGSGSNNYTRIQDAIDDANDGDTIFVYNGTYYENLIINKEIYLIGKNRNATIIDGCASNNAVKICADNVRIAGFTVRNTIRYKHIWMSSGIEVFQSDHMVIENNLFINNYVAISIISSSNCVLRNNTMFNCSISFYGFSLKYYIHDIDTSNVVNGKPIYYYRDLNGLTPPSDVGELILVNCSTFNISNINIDNVTISIQICYSNNNIIHNNSFLNNAEGIFLFESNHNTIRNNTCYSNDWDGIFLYFSDYNIVRNNHCLKNGDGIVLYNSKKNKIISNVVENSIHVSIHVDNSNENEFLYNNIIDRPKGGHSLLHHFSFFNKWDRNYWSKWIGLKFKALDFLPKVIIGFVEIIDKPYKPIPYFDFDWHPAKEPYDI